MRKTIIITTLFTFLISIHPHTTFAKRYTHPSAEEENRIYQTCLVKKSSRYCYSYLKGLTNRKEKKKEIRKAIKIVNEQCKRKTKRACAYKIKISNIKSKTIRKEFYKTFKVKSFLTGCPEHVKEMAARPLKQNGIYCKGDYKKVILSKLKCKPMDRRSVEWSLTLNGKKTTPPPCDGGKQEVKCLRYIGCKIPKD